MRDRIDDLKAQALDAGDSAQAARLRLEASARRAIVDANELDHALGIVERAASQLGLRGLERFAERVGRAYSRALLRLGVEQRAAVRRVLRAARGDGR